MRQMSHRSLRPCADCALARVKLLGDPLGERVGYWSGTGGVREGAQ
jgi:hypothetical protein